jgi:O-antigen/teichoic acid export membrane protein
MNATLKKSLFKKILAGSLIFYIFSGVSSLLNYAFYPVIARFVTTSQYGEIQFLVSMFTQLAVGFVVLNILAIVISTEIAAQKDQRRAIRSLNLVSCAIILLIVIIGSLVLYLNQSALGFTDSTAILALGASLVINVPFTVAIGRLQGNGKFMASGVISMLGAFFKLAFSVLFVMIGWGVTGAILGIGIGMLVSLIIIEIASAKIPKEQWSFSPKTALSTLRFIRKRAVIAMLAITVITLLSTADSIVSRLVLNSHMAGQYAAVATLAKVILAATSPLMWLALPPAVARDKRSILLFSGIALGISTLAWMAFGLFPEFFLHILLGIEAGAFVSLLSPAAFAMALCSVAFIAISVSICAGALKNALFSTLFAVASYFIVYLTFSQAIGSIQASIYAQMAGSLCFIIGGLVVLKTHFAKT